MVSGRLSRLQAAGNVMTGPEQVLIEDWCQQYPSHSIGAVEFGPDGNLYASGGDGASFNFVDYGQDGAPLNPCGDPPGPPGTALTSPTAEGGALRSQDLRTGGDPVSLDGSVIRVNPATGAGAPSNPMAASTDANARRIIAHGLRNPFRFTFRPGTSELWLGDVGWNDWEELNRIPNATDAVMENFGWPCYEGVGRQSGYDNANLSICENLYAAANAVAAPYFAYHHSNRVVPNEGCPTGSSATAGLEFQFSTGNSYPAEYQDALFFADYSRDCIWVMPKGTNGLPAPGQIKTFVAGAANPVNLEIGQAGICSTSTSTAAPSTASGTSVPTGPPWPWRRPRPPPARRRSRSPSTAPAPATPTLMPSPTPGTSTSTAPTTTPPPPGRPGPIRPTAATPPSYG
jgi:glucose/arabinose dehydrogenase